MAQYAKLENNQLTPFIEGSTVKIGETLVTNPSIEMLESEGYKEVIHTDGDTGVYEDGNYIIVETPKYIPKVLTADDQREIAYNVEPVIEWNGALKTCDFIRGLMVTYKEIEAYEKVVVVKALWMAGREAIQRRYPSIEENI